MSLRPARFSDLTELAELCCAAFFDEDLFGRVMHPHRHEYPNDPALFWHQFLLDHWFDWRNKAFVAITRDTKDGAREKIAGIAIWQRQGEGGRKLELNGLDPRNLLAPLSKLSNRLTSIIYPNRALDPTKTNLLSSAIPFYVHHWTGERQENWYLSLCATHPDHQGKGFGRELVNWGLKQAEEENVHASVMSSDGKENFYLKCGFHEIVGNATEGEGNPLAGVGGGAILFKYPKRA